MTIRRAQADGTVPHAKFIVMQTLNVALGERSYPIYIGGGLLERPDLIVERLPQKAAIITIPQ